MPDPSLRRLPALARAGRRWLALPPLLLVAACGGGGGDAGVPLSQSYNLDVALTSALATSVRVDKLTARDPLGMVHTLSFNFAPGADAMFEGRLHKTSVQTITLTSGGITESDTASAYYDTGPYRAVGAIASDGAYTVSVRTGDLPTLAVAGSSGPLSTDTVYTDSTQAVVYATAVTSWSLEADTETTAFACMKSLVTELSPPATFSQTVCLRINTVNGLAGGGRFSISTGGVTLDFR